MVIQSEKGTRNDWLFWAACRFGEFVAEGLVGSEVAERLLVAAANELAEEDGQRAVAATIASGLRTGSASRVAAPHFDAVDMK
jgi:hypothetical protein